MDSFGQRALRAQRQQDVYVVRHDDKTIEPVALAVKTLQRRGDNIAKFFSPEPTATKSAVQPTLNSARVVQFQLLKGPFCPRLWLLLQPEFFPVPEIFQLGRGE